MNSDFRLFLDIKRELENRIAELKNNTDTYQYEKTINDLKHQNVNLMEQIIEKQKELEIAQDEIALLRSENEKNKEELLPQQISENQDNCPNTSVWNRILNFFNG